MMLSLLDQKKNLKRKPNNKRMSKRMIHNPNKRDKMTMKNPMTKIKNVDNGKIKKERKVKKQTKKKKSPLYNQ